MKNVINRILKIISSAVFVVLVLLIALIVIYIVRVNFLASNDKLGDVKINFYTILTQSMYPTIKAGDIVITYKEDNDKYNVGDVITFISDKNGGITVTHRVQEIFNVNNSYSYRTKGDNNNTADSEVIGGDNVLGKVWIAVVILPCLGVVIYDILKLIRNVASRGKNLVKKDDRTEEARKKLKEVVEDDEE